MYTLGPFKMEQPFLLAPMAGITNSAYRRLMRRMGSSIVISELVSANGLVFGSRRTEELLSFHEDERPIGLQIFGEESEALVEACLYIEKLGANFVDLNLGCPVHKIVKKGAGCAMCRDPKKLGKILEAMVSAVKIPVSIKVRTGWNAESINILEVLHAAEEAGVMWMAIHGRTRAQAYTGEADWDLIGEVKAKAKIPIIGNGDVKTPERAVELFRKYSVDAVMIGRGALRNPFFFQQSAQLLTAGNYELPTATDYFELMQKQKGFLRLNPNPRSALLQSKKFLAWYSAGFPNSHEFRQRLFSLHDFEEVWATGIQFFEERIDDRTFEYLNQPFLMGGHG